MAGCRGSQRTAAARFSYEGSSPDYHRARRPHPGILRPLSFPVERLPQPPAGAAWVCPTRRPHTPTYAADGGFQSVIPAASAAWRRPRLPQWSWAAAWAIGHMRTTGQPWRSARRGRDKVGKTLEHHTDRPEPARDQARPPGRREGHRTIERDARRFRPTRSPTPPDTSAPGSGRCTAPATTTGA